MCSYYSKEIKGQLLAKHIVRILSRTVIILQDEKLFRTAYVPAACKEVGSFPVIFLNPLLSECLYSGAHKLERSTLPQALSSEVISVAHGNIPTDIKSPAKQPLAPQITHHLYSFISINSSELRYFNDNIYNLKITYL